jgi:hypothetical protein
MDALIAMVGNIPPEQLALLTGGAATLAVGGMEKFGGTRFKWLKVLVFAIADEWHRQDADKAEKAAKAER